jgi:hypothetical protein
MARIPRTKIGKAVGEAMDSWGCAVILIIVLVPLLTSILLVEGVR